MQQMKELVRLQIHKIFIFDEEEALDNFIDRLRALNRLRGYKVKTVTSI